MGKIAQLGHNVPFLTDTRSVMLQIGALIAVLVDPSEWLKC